MTNATEQAADASGRLSGTATVKSGALASDRVTLDFVRYASVIDGFKLTVREQAFDISELAIVSYLIARDSP
ncbi:hypothetical protein AAFG07_30565 [Bradyrhizobium sp. B097]|uniref:hypothetical protein n=1 Tax=Bradyrhizobium sp. B097 TaxID=3140244 RepID=UPI00318396E3